MAVTNSCELLLVGVGRMGIDYAKVLKNNSLKFTAIGRSTSAVRSFEQETNVKAEFGGLESYLTHRDRFEAPLIVIICVNNAETFNVTKLLVGAHQTERLKLRGILVEKPLASSPEQALEVAKLLVDAGIHAFVAFNRRFYPTVQRLKSILQEDGGAEYVHFEFNEWEERFEKASTVISTFDIKNWQFGNGCHVIDTALYLAGGLPLQVQAISTAGNCHSGNNFPVAAAFGGSAITTHGTAVTWKSYFRHRAPWMIEVVTSRKIKYQLNPLETLVRINPGSTEPEVILSLDQVHNQTRHGLEEMLGAFLQSLNDGEADSSSPLAHISQYERLLEKVYTKICAPPRPNVVVIGGGNISHRYIQGFLRGNQAPYIYVSEPNESQKKKLLGKLVEEDEQSLTNYVSIFKTPTEYFLPRQADLLLSVTTAGARFASLIDMMNRIKYIRCIVLEKPTFTLSAQWDQFLKISKGKRIPVYSAAGGCTLFSEPITSLVEWNHANPENTIQVHVTGSDWGLCCNSVHFFAQFAVINQLVDGIDVSSTGTYKIEAQLNGIVPGKREGTYDVESGCITLIHVPTAAPVVYLECSATYRAHQERMYQSNGLAVTYVPGEPNATLVTPNMCSSLSVDVMHTSQMGPLLLEELRSTNGALKRLLQLSAVETFERPLLSIFAEHFSKHNIDTTNGVPIS